MIELYEGPWRVAVGGNGPLAGRTEDHDLRHVHPTPNRTNEETC